MSVVSDSTHEVIDAGVPVIRCVLLDSHRDDIEKMKATGYIADWRGAFLASHSAGFLALKREGYSTNSGATEPTKENSFAYPQPDGGWIVCRLGVPAQRETDCWHPNAQGYAMARVRGPKPHICINTGDLTEMVDESIQALASAENVFQRGGLLVRVVRNSPPPQFVKRPEDTPTIEPLPEPSLRERLQQVAIYEALTKEGFVRKDVPQIIVRTVAARKDWPNVPTIEMVSEVPQFLRDGSILDTPGFHQQTGILYHPTIHYPPLVTVEEAIRRIDDVLADFPFATPAHKSTVVAAILTVLARSAFEGPAPMFLADANRAGAGKSMLMQLIALIGLGRYMATMVAAGDDAEWRKRITAVALAGEPVVLIDNIKQQLKSDALDAALTSTVWSDRLLCTSQTVRVPLGITWFGTGCNTQSDVETIRRIAPIRLESPLEKPEQRDGFRYPNLVDHVRKIRGQLTSAALSILVEYHRNKKPDMGLKPWGSFEGWSNLIRNAVVWAGLPDPADTRDDFAATAAGPDTDLHRMLLIGWQEADPLGIGLTVAEAVEATSIVTEHGPKAPTLIAALDELPEYHRKNALGQKLKRFKGCNLGGMRFERAKRGTVEVWKVLQ